MFVMLSLTGHGVNIPFLCGVNRAEREDNLLANCLRVGEIAPSGPIPQSTC